MVPCMQSSSCFLQSILISYTVCFLGRGKKRAGQNQEDPAEKIDDEVKDNRSEQGTSTAVGSEAPKGKLTDNIEGRRLSYLFGL